MAKTNKPDWIESLHVFQRLKYRGAAGMLTFALVLVAVVLTIVAWRVSDSAVQMTLIIVVCIVAVAFFGAFFAVVRVLGPIALMDATQVMAAWKMAAKNAPSISPSGPPVLGAGGASLIPPPEPEVSQQ